MGVEKEVLMQRILCTLIEADIEDEGTYVFLNLPGNFGPDI
jgi:hypothetical protein